MKKVLSVLLSVSMLAAVFSACSRAEEFTFCSDLEKSDVSVVSFNVAAPWGNILKGTSSSTRVKRFAAYMNAVKPDIIGTQEMNSDWMGKLSELISDYDSYGVIRGGDDKEKKSEMNSIFWLKDKYECVEKNTFWLSETPDEESKYEGAGCYRVCSYAMLRDIQTDNYILALNTHLDNASEEARAFGAQVILNKLDEIKAASEIKDYTVILTGDFNNYFESEACQLLSGRFNTVKADGNTYHDWGNITEDEPIDFIFSSGEVKWTLLLDDTSNGYVSDHWGIYSTISIGK